MPVYFLGEDENGCSPVKIGIAKNIEARKRDLQTGNPLELRLLGWIETVDAWRGRRPWSPPPLSRAERDAAGE